MLIDHYVRQVETHPMLKPILSATVGPAVMTGGRDHSDMTRLEWVERHVDDVQVMPFSELDMHACNSGVESAAHKVRYEVYYHYAGVEEPCHRLKYQAEGHRLVETLTVIRGQNRAFAPDQLVVDAIVRHTEQRIEGERYYHEVIQAYLLQPGDSQHLLRDIPVPPQIVHDATFMQDEHLGYS